MHRHRITDGIICITLSRKVGDGRFVLRTRKRVPAGPGTRPARLQGQPINSMFEDGAPAMKTTARSAQFYFRLCLHSFLFVLLTFRVQAHDPGLSSAMVTVGNEQIDVLLGFAQKDVESMIATGPNAADNYAAKGFAAIQTELESVAANGFSLYLGRQRVIPDQATARRWSKIASD